MAKRPTKMQTGVGEVGYGRPPRATQFKPGQSGNPKGRPKGSLNLATVLARTLREKVVVTEGGRRRTITKLEASVKQLVNKSASGDERALRLLVQLADAAEARAEAAPSTQESLPEADRQVMQSLLARIRKHGTGDPVDEPDHE